ncbi:MAG: DNA-3-methyladenine glycosylase [Candidatus Eremiobacterota bacterium]
MRAGALEALTPLPSGFFARDTAEVARDLLGVWLLHEGVGGPLVETEAYRDGDDPASHAFRGPTPRSRVMFEEPGRAYVYFIYGNHFCLNVVAHPEGRAGAVLLRALEPRMGLQEMARRRGRSQPRELAAGPGRLCQALGVDRRHNGLWMLDGSLCLARSAESFGPVRAGPRVGIRAAREEPLRFSLEGNPYVSRGPG